MSEGELVLYLQPEDGAPLPNGDLWTADRELRASGVKADPRVFIQDGIEQAITHLGEWTIKAGPFVAPAVAAVAGAWLQARVGRKVRLKYGTVEVEARTPAEVQKLLALIPPEPVSPTQEGGEK